MPLRNLSDRRPACVVQNLDPFIHSVNILRTPSSSLNLVRFSPPRRLAFWHFNYPFIEDSHPTCPSLIPVDFVAFGLPITSEPILRIPSILIIQEQPFRPNSNILGRPFHFDQLL